MTARFHVLGTLVLDRVYHVDRLPGHDEKVAAHQVYETVGGPACNAARALIGLGVPVAVHSIAGTDAAGRMIEARLAELGVGIGAIRRLPDMRTPVVTILVDESGERAIILDPFAETDLVRIGAEATFAPTDTIVSNLFHPEALRSVAGRARAAGARLLVDLELAELERWGLGESLISVQEADVLVTNAQALRKLARADSLAAAADFARALAGERRAACVTLGGRGAVFAQDGAVRHCPALPIAPRDTTGAGDTFIAALAYADRQGMPMDDAIRFATVAAADVLTEGPRPVTETLNTARTLILTDLGAP